MRTRRSEELKTAAQSGIESTMTNSANNRTCCRPQIVHKNRSSTATTMLSIKMTTSSDTTSMLCTPTTRTMSRYNHQHNLKLSNHQHRHHNPQDVNIFKSLATSCFMFLVTIMIVMPISIISTSYALQHSPIELAGQQFTCGKLYYRTFHMDQQRNVLYVGAMDNLFKVNLANINKTNCLDDAIRLEPSDPQKCITKGKSEAFECRNHVRVIQPTSRLGDKLYVCGTNAYNPRDYLIHAGNFSSPTLDFSPGGGSGHLSSGGTVGVGGPAQAECPFDPDDNSTAIWVEKGNGPSDSPAIYTGTVTDSNKADPLIFRSELYNQTSGLKVHEAKRTTKYDSKVLDKPNFVGSFEIGEYVYFFFRESAVEYINCGKSIYSRVARVCKRDNGFKPAMFEKVWTTFLKARLNCSIPGEFPFYFDEIQSIYRNPYDDKKFHAVFTTSNNGLTGSAICTFSLDAIQEAFNGKFKEQQSSTAAWLPVPIFKLNHNEPRPGSCVEDTQLLSDSLVTFVRGHPLMDSAVANDNGRPVFFRRDLMFTKIVVDIIEIDGIRYTVYFVGTSTGHVYKIVEWYSWQPPPTSGSSSTPTMGDTSSSFGSMLSDSSASNQQTGGSSTSSGSSSSSNGPYAQSTLVEVIEATVPEPVRAMEISSRHKSLYVASDSQIRQINLLNCKQRHDSCMQCVRDPYCGWDRKHLECRHFSPMDPANLIQDLTNQTPDICHSAMKHKDVHVTWGQSVHLPCKFNGFIQESQDLQQLLAAQQRQQQQQMLSAPSGQFLAQSLNDQQLQQVHHLAAPNYVQWYYHRRDNVLSPGYPVLQRRDRFVLAADRGLVIMNANEPGWYQCRLGNQIIYSYNLIIDTKTCAAPNEMEFKRVYSDWCREIERYKSAYRNWHAKQNRCQAMNRNQQQQQQQQQQQTNMQVGQQMDSQASEGAAIWTGQ